MLVCFLLHAPTLNKSANLCTVQCLLRPAMLDATLVGWRRACYGGASDIAAESLRNPCRGMGHGLDVPRAVVALILFANSVPALAHPSTRPSIAPAAFLLGAAWRRLKPCCSACKRACLRKQQAEQRGTGP